MNLLSVAAAYGVVALVLQGGWAGQLVGIDTATPLPAFVPVLMFAVLFGLSMDYEVFLVSRMREAWLRTGDNERADPRGAGRPPAGSSPPRRRSWWRCSPRSCPSPDVVLKVDRRRHGLGDPHRRDHRPAAAGARRDAPARPGQLVAAGVAGRVGSPSCTSRAARRSTCRPLRPRPLARQSTQTATSGSGAGDLTAASRPGWWATPDGMRGPMVNTGRHERRDPSLVEVRRRLPDLPAQLRRLRRRRHRRPRRHHRPARPPARPRRRRAVAVADLPLAAGRQRLRHQRLPGHRPGVRHARAVRRAARGRARAGHEAGDGPGRQPHLRRARRGSSSPAPRGTTRSATGTSGAMPATAAPAPQASRTTGARSSPALRGRTTTPPGSTTFTCSTGSSPTSTGRTPRYGRRSTR